MPLAALLAKLEKLAARLARRRDEDIALVCGIEDRANRLLTAQRIAVFVRNLRIVRERTLSDDEGHRTPCLQRRAEAFHSGAHVFSSRLLREHEMLDLQKFEQRKRHLALIGVLRLVLHARLAAPADDEDQRNRIRLLVQQGRERIDDVALTAVLQIDERRATRREIMPRRDSRRRPLVRRDDVRRMIAVSLHQGVAKSAQLRVGHADEKICAQDVQKLRRLHDVLLLPVIHSFGTSSREKTTE